MNETIRAVSSETRTEKYVDTIERDISPDDSSMVRRLVGYWEYLNALQNLDRLASSLSESERRELDDYIHERNLFAVNVNLSARLQTKNSTLADPPGGEKERRGLNWMTALARVELGSMLSGYTRIPKPYEFVRPTQHDVDAYRYLLLDGLRSHYWSLKMDRSIDYLLGSKNIYNVLSYSRRMQMVRSMLGTLVRSGRQWTFPEQQELKGWNRDIEDLSGLFAMYIQRFLREEVESGTRTVTKSQRRYLSRICGAILQGERSEIAAGTATHSSYTVSEGGFGTVGGQ